jgi:hypothetical protein
LRRWVFQIAVREMELQIAGGFEPQRQQALGPGWPDSGKRRERRIRPKF